MSFYLDTNTMHGVGRKRRTTVRRRRVGAGFFGDVWSGIKSVAPAVLRATGLASKAANFIPYVGPAASAIIRSQGYGRAPVRRRRAAVGGRRKRRVRRHM